MIMGYLTTKSKSPEVTTFDSDHNDAADAALLLLPRLGHDQRTSEHRRQRGMERAAAGCLACHQLVA